LKVLMSAFACAPGIGSEAGVGWNWAVEAARLGHEVVVLTRPRFRAAIEAATAAPDAAAGALRVLYLDLPAGLVAALGRGLGALAGHYAHYCLWQALAVRRACRLHRERRFDLVHHLTYVTVRFPSFMGLVGAPFVFGPGSGGEAIPAALRAALPLRARAFEAFRDLANLFVRVDPLARFCLGRADLLLVATAETLRVLPRRLARRACVAPAIGCAPVGPAPPHAAARAAAGGAPLRILCAGRLGPSKGLGLALAATAAARRRGLACSLEVVGDGPEAARLKALAVTLGLADALWRPRLPQDALLVALAEHDVFLSPTLRESGGMAILEALGAGLPVVCLKASGPGLLVDASCGVAVEPSGGIRPTVSGLAAALVRLADPELRARLSEGARRRAEAFAWPSVVGLVYGPGGLAEGLLAAGPAWGALPLPAAARAGARRAGTP